MLPNGMSLESNRKKVFKRLQKYIIRIAENQGQFLKLIQNVIKMT